MVLEEEINKNNINPITEYYKVFVVANRDRLMVALTGDTLEERLAQLSLAELAKANLKIEEVEILRDYIIQDEIDRIMQAYSGEKAWQVEVRLGRALRVRPSIYIAEIAKQMNYCSNITIKFAEEQDKEKKDLRSIMNLLMLAAEAGRRVTINFQDIFHDICAIKQEKSKEELMEETRNWQERFRADARKLLYGLMCEDLEQTIRKQSPYPQFTHEQIRELVPGERPDYNQNKDIAVVLSYIPSVQSRKCLDTGVYLNGSLAIISEDIEKWNKIADMIKGNIPVPPEQVKLKVVIEHILNYNRQAIYVYAGQIVVITKADQVRQMLSGRPVDRDRRACIMYEVEIAKYLRQKETKMVLAGCSCHWDEKKDMAEREGFELLQVSCTGITVTDLKYMKRMHVK